ncbi:MAG TPA: aminoglycoside phosphotransferase family protein [Pseudoneobacillus sp.]|nr:aminoglycoside phosphotransferase family protein [Pseudoneobacillus sp.]
MTEKLLIGQLTNTYGKFAPIRLTGGYTNETFLLEGIQPPLVAKVSNTFNKDIENEINCLKLMQETGIVPGLYESFQTDNQQITVIEYCEGKNAQSIMDNGDLEKTSEIYKLLGNTLAKNIHAQKYTFNSKGIRECNVNEILFNLEFVPQELINVSKEMMGSLTDRKEDWVLTHGDYGVHNVLFSPNNSLTVLDWEWSEWANPLTDVAWVCWFTGLHYKEWANQLTSLFVEEYKKYNPINLPGKKLKGYCVYKVWKVLHKVKNAPIEVQEEWIRRLNWTLETDIFDF